MLHCNFNEPQPSLECQIGRPRMCAQTLRRSSDHNAYRMPGTTLEYSVARAPGHGANALCKNEVAIEWQLKVGGEGEEVRCQAREGVVEASG